LRKGIRRSQTSYAPTYVGVPHCLPRKEEERETISIPNVINQNSSAI